MPASSLLADRLRSPGTVLLDGARTDADTGTRGAWLYSDPLRTLQAETPWDVPRLLRDLDAALAEGGHVAGLLAYEAGAGLVGLPVSHAAEPPVAWFGVYADPEWIPAEALDRLVVPLARPVRPAFGWTEATYAARVEAVRAAIRDGEVYQINLTMPVRFALEGDVFGLYTSLRRRQAVSYGAWLSLPDGRTLASVSPELFVRIDSHDGRRTATARPMKGTAARGRTRLDDARHTADLLARPKDRAENLMIVDLLRNDLSRVAVPGTVRVPALFTAEHYDTVTQMTSTVTATLRDDISVGDVLAATFPCGSVTGAPKRRAMELIGELEDGARGVYCGAIGRASPDGTAAFNVAIRTAVVRDGEGVYGVGSGIVWDSDAALEWAECHLKAEVLTGMAL